MQDILHFGVHPGKLEEMNSISHVTRLLCVIRIGKILFEAIIIGLDWQLSDTISDWAQSIWHRQIHTLRSHASSRSPMGRPIMVLSFLSSE
jgi:hypothetical protein